MQEKIVIFLKGMLMGISDLIPGISGGTIAFITGIYERLINAISQISVKSKFNFFGALFRGDMKKVKKLWKHHDTTFLIILFAGIITAILSGAKAIDFLLREYFIYVISFFIGLIIASCKIIYDHIPTHNKTNVYFGFLGILLGLAILLISPQTVTNPAWYYLTFGGFIAVSALFLPGISGSFILLILGLYGFIIRALNDLTNNLDVFLYFGIGALIGIYFISRAITFLFKKDKAKTLYTLLGLVIGTLIIPIMEVVGSIKDPSIPLYLALIVFVIAGASAVILIDKNT